MKSLFLYTSLVAITFLGASSQAANWSSAEYMKQHYLKNKANYNESKPWKDWTMWRARCVYYGKCHIGKKNYIVKKSGNKVKVVRVSQAAYEAHKPTGVPTGTQPDEVLNAVGDTNKPKTPPKPTKKPVVAEKPPAPKPVPQNEATSAVASKKNVEALPGCKGLYQPIYDKFQRCAKSKGLRIPANCPVSILDAERGWFYVMDPKGTKCHMNVRAAIGKNGRPPKPGRGPGTGKTPSGLFMTKVHSGRRYGSTNSVGIRCISQPECRSTVARGVIIHGSSRNGVRRPTSSPPRRTLGCTMLNEGKFREYHRIMQGGRKKCPYFVYFNEGKCGGATKYPAKSTLGSSGSRNSRR